MEMIDSTLDSSQDEKPDSPNSDHIDLSHDDSDEQNAVIVGNTPGTTLTLDANGQYRLTSDSAQGTPLTYRVVQVGPSDDGQILSGAQVIGPNYSGSDDDTKISYLPAVAGGGDGLTLGQDGSVLNQVTSAGGQFYVMMSPHDVLQATGQRVIAPRSLLAQRIDAATTRTVRDERRRASHNEVERRRRDKINNWIVQLSKCIPDCAAEGTKAGQVSKGGILAKACDYINELRHTNALMQESIKDTERMQLDNDIMRQQVEDLRQENTILRQKLHQHGLLGD